MIEKPTAGGIVNEAFTTADKATRGLGWVNGSTLVADGRELIAEDGQSETRKREWW